MNKLANRMVGIYLLWMGANGVFRAVALGMMGNIPIAALAMLEAAVIVVGGCLCWSWLDYREARI